MPVTLITPATAEPVTLEEAREQLRRTDTHEDDAYITALIKAATELVEQNTGRSLIDTKWMLTLRDFPCSGTIMLSRSPLLEVQSVSYYDTNGKAQVLTEGTEYFVGLGEPYTVEAVDGRWPATQCRPDAVQVVFRAGYVDMTGSPAPDGEVPSIAKLAIKQLVSNWFENREPVVTGMISSTIPIGVGKWAFTLKEENGHPRHRGNRPSRR
jgi:uncharacterized phiE125 gp8 family phage protein